MKDTKDIPPLVWAVTMSGYGFPIGLSTYYEALDKHPEYFPKEVEHRRKWNAVPEEVKEAYFAAHMKLYEYYRKDQSHRGKGLMFMIDNPAAMKEVDEYNEKVREEFEQKEKELHDKYFKQYGL